MIQKLSKDVVSKMPQSEMHTFFNGQVCNCILWAKEFNLKKIQEGELRNILACFKNYKGILPKMIFQILKNK